VIFDKTGTLTEGKPKVTNVLACKAQTPEEVLALAASIERLSEHPLAQAVVHAAREKNLLPKDVVDFENVAGKGVRGKIGNVAVMVGSVRLLQQSGISLTAHLEALEEYEGDAKTVIAVACRNELIGMIAIADSLKEDARAAVARLRTEGVETVMATGDNRKTAEAIAKETGIDRVFAEVLPQDKANKVRELQAAARRVAFVGDGINDAPALVQADLGIAMGTGTDIAIEAGNIVLVKGHPLKVIEALRLSRLTFRTIKQNLFWAFFYNVAAIPLAALGLLNPMIAAAAMAGSSLTVVGTSRQTSTRNST
jgi:Cu+-exporting ATPase